MDAVSQRDPYAVLGVGRDATAAEVKAAYRARAKERHPDAGGDAGAFAEVSWAYSVLSDPASRRAHDLGAARGAAGVAEPGGSAGERPAEDADPLAWDEMLDGLGGWPEEPSFERAGGGWSFPVTLRVTPEEAEAGFRKRITVRVPGRPARVQLVVDGEPGRRAPYDVTFPAMGRPEGGGWSDLVVRVRLSPRRPGRAGAGV